MGPPGGGLRHLGNSGTRYARAAGREGGREGRQCILGTAERGRSVLVVCVTAVLSISCAAGRDGNSQGGGRVSLTNSFEGLDVPNRTPPLSVSTSYAELDGQAR